MSSLVQKPDNADQKFLAEYYESGLIPAEKKPFLIDLQKSSGPFLALESGDVIMDLASQIASNGLGFNSGALFGVTQYLESWTGDIETPTIDGLREAYRTLLQRKLDWPRLFMHVCNSGAEAIETALGACYERREYPAAKRILAFEGSFHGRMLAALTATWNPKKREPFQWPGFEAEFAPYPELVDDSFGCGKTPTTWNELCTPKKLSDDNLAQLETSVANDPIMAFELECLQDVRLKLESGNIFAVIIEPMQCEGGDRYSSIRFHQSLCKMAKAFEIPIIYDEIQTGFHLGREFFWHRQFGTAENPPPLPDYVVCAKKAQTGLVLSREPISFREAVTPHSLARGYIQASVLDQYQDEVLRIEAFVKARLPGLVKQYEGALRRPRVCGLAFAFDFENAERSKKFVEQRFQHGLLYYPAGEKTARFRLNLSMRDSQLELAWQQLKSALASTFDATENDLRRVQVSLKQIDGYLDYQEQSLRAKLELNRGHASTDESAVSSFIFRQIARIGMAPTDFEVTLLDSENYPEFRDRVMAMQTAVYEPARQTSVKEFDKVFAAENHLAITITSGKRIIGMAFGATIGDFGNANGVRDDVEFDNPKVIYMIDLTVDAKHRGQLGRILKQAMVLLAQVRDLEAIHGRNRDRLAAGMWAINLALGSYETQYLENDYNDEHDHRDCICYRCPVRWDEPPINLSNAVESPLPSNMVDIEFVNANWQSLVNKVTLSNFVDRQFLSNLKSVFGLFPKSLRHGYTTSGLSECVDKITKVFWYHRRPRCRLVSIGGSSFGEGSFLARGLSGIGQKFFDVFCLDFDESRNEQRLLDQLTLEISSDQVLAVFLEPLNSRTMERLSKVFLGSVIKVCNGADVPVVFNESSGLFYRYDRAAFSPSGVQGLLPDASIAHLGGQMGIVATNRKYFLDEPLLLISTWDGDAYNLAAFQRAAQMVQADPNAYFEIVDKFDSRLRGVLANSNVNEFDLAGGCGWFEGEVPESLARCFQRSQSGRYLSCSSFGQMKYWLESNS